VRTNQVVLVSNAFMEVHLLNPDRSTEQGVIRQPNRCTSRIGDLRDTMVEVGICFSVCITFGSATDLNGRDQITIPKIVRNAGLLHSGDIALKPSQILPNQVFIHEVLNPSRATSSRITMLRNSIIRHISIEVPNQCTSIYAPLTRQHAA
jgi:hypothetical protein